MKLKYFALQITFLIGLLAVHPFHAKAMDSEQWNAERSPAVTRIRRLMHSEEFMKTVDSKANPSVCLHRSDDPHYCFSPDCPSCRLIKRFPSSVFSLTEKDTTKIPVNFKDITKDNVLFMQKAFGGLNLLINSFHQLKPNDIRGWTTMASKGLKATIDWQTRFWVMVDSKSCTGYEGKEEEQEKENFRSLFRHSDSPEYSVAEEREALLQHTKRHLLEKFEADKKKGKLNVFEPDEYIELLLMEANAALQMMVAEHSALHNPLTAVLASAPTEPQPVPGPNVATTAVPAAVVNILEADLMRRAGAGVPAPLPFQGLKDDAKSASEPASVSVPKASGVVAAVPAAAHPQPLGGRGVDANIAPAPSLTPIASAPAMAAAPILGVSQAAVGTSESVSVPGVPSHNSGIVSNPVASPNVPSPDFQIGGNAGAAARPEEGSKAPVQGIKLAPDKVMEAQMSICSVG